MGTILASSIIARASELAQDEENVTWTDSQALAWVNDAQRAICLIRPDASVLNSSIQLTPGTKQEITGRRLMSVIRNMGVDGSTPGKIIRLVEQGSKDDEDEDWHTEAAATVIKEFIFDIRDPKRFYVSPPVHATTAVYAEILQATNPTDIATSSDPIDIDDVYSTVMIEWVCYRFFGRDSEETPNYIRAAGYFRSVFNLLGEKMKVDMVVNPKVRAHLK